MLLEVCPNLKYGKCKNLLTEIYLFNDNLILGRLYKSFMFNSETRVEVAD
jgi:hypothetical protein